MSKTTPATSIRDTDWLAKYYAVRATFSVAWVIVACAIGNDLTPLGATLLVVYPAWDALANLYDARRNGGFRKNTSQMFNAVVSTFVAVAVLATLVFDIHSVFTVFGLWAAFSGILQLATGIRRWRAFSGQWPMILSGAQSAFAGTHFIQKAASGVMPTCAGVAPYAAFGALYFAIAAISLLVSMRRRAAKIRLTRTGGPSRHGA